MPEGLKEKDLRKNCGICGLGICNNNGIQLYGVTITPHIMDLGAVQRQAGLEMQLGGAVAIAQVMGANEYMTKAAYRAEFLVCQQCAMKTTCLCSMLETFNDNFEELQKESP